MELWEFFENPNTRNNRILEEVRRAQRRANRSAASHEEQLATLADENADLKLHLFALLNVLIAKGAIAKEEMNDMIQSMLPASPPPEEPNPFTGLTS